jgi:molybdopterin synthase sulfur carrier subunit
LNPHRADLPKIKVQLKLYGTLRRHKPDGLEVRNRQPFIIEIPQGSSVVDMISMLNIGQGFVAAVAINGQAAELRSQLHDGDEVRLFPPSAGG